MLNTSSNNNNFGTTVEQSAEYNVHVSNFQSSSV